jgi:hypothetical protein
MQVEEGPPYLGTLAFHLCIAQERPIAPAVPVKEGVGWGNLLK